MTEPRPSGDSTMHDERPIARIAPMVRAFLACRRGTVAMIFYILVVPMLLTVGGAVDFGRAYNYRALVGSAADAAALAGARDANKYLAENGTGSAQQTKASEIADASARRFLTAKVASFGLNAAPTIGIATQVDGRQATVSVSVQGYVQTQLLKLTGISQLPFSAASKATMKPGNDQYYQVIFVVDVSNSMGIGGTPAAITALNNHPEIGCAFACHDPNQYSQATEACGKTITTTIRNGYYEYRWVGWSYRQVWVPPVTQTTQQPHCDKREIARSANIKLKIDYVNSAVNEFMTDLIQLNGASSSAGHYSVGLYTLGTTSKRILQSTSNLSLAQSLAADIDVEVAAPSTANYGYSYISAGLNYASSDIKNIGDGSSSAKMKTYVIFISDAVQDLPINPPWGRTSNLSYASECTLLKNKGATIFSIWTGYSEIANHGLYDSLVRPLSAQLPTTMQSCASSPAQYFLASDGPAIQTAVDNTFKVIAAGSNLRLTQ